MWMLLYGCSGPDEPSDERACNGSPALCDKALEEVTFAVAHNAMNAEEDGFTIPNQHYNYERQVEDGIFGFMLDVHDDAGVPSLCHGACSLGSEPLSEGLARFDALLDSHPDDLFVFIVQDEIDAPPIVSAFESSGLLDRTLEVVDPAVSLGELIDDDLRLIVTHEVPREGSPPWYHAAYDLMWDNDYAASTVEDFDCEVLRGDRSNPLFLLNHFLTNGIGSEQLATEANPEAIIREHVDRCEVESGDRVNFVAVDFYDVGDVVSVVGALNAR